MNVMENGTINHGKVTIDRIDPRLLQGEPTYLFNIYSREYNRNTGSTGAFYIPPCPAGKEYVRGPQAVPGTVADTYPHFQESESYRVRATVGEDIVKAVLGIGAGQNASMDIRKWGVFASKNAKPTKEELAEARKQLIPTLQKAIREADEWSASADPVLRQSIDQHHYDAANFLGVKRAWMSVSEATGSCVFCGSPQKEGVPRCGSCGEITDQALYDSLKAKISGTKSAN